MDFSTGGAGLDLACTHRGGALYLGASEFERGTYPLGLAKAGVGAVSTKGGGALNNFGGVSAGAAACADTDLLAATVDQSAQSVTSGDLSTGDCCWKHIGVLERERRLSPSLSCKSC